MCDRTLLNANNAVGNIASYFDILATVGASNLDNLTDISVVASIVDYLADISAAGALATTAQSSDYGPYSVAIGNGGFAIGGSEDDNVLSGTDGNDVVMGFDGNDILNTGIGNDRAHGGNGNDIIAGENGADILNGGDGNDTLFADVEDTNGLAFENTFVDFFSIGQQSFFNEISWTAYDGEADYLDGGKGFDNYHVGAWGGTSIFFDGQGNVISSGRSGTSMVWNLDASGFSFNDRVYEELDIISDSDGLGEITWGLSGTGEITNSGLNINKNDTGTFSSQSSSNGEVSQEFSDLFGQQTWEITGLDFNFRMLAQVHVHIDETTGETTSRLILFTDPYTDGIVNAEDLRNGNTNFALFAIEHFEK